MDLGGIFEPGRSKMVVLGGHIEVQECFSYQRPTKCGPNDVFFLVFERIFRVFLESFFMIFLISHFLMKKHEFSRIVVLPKREHHF